MLLRPARFPVRKNLLRLATSINRAKRCGYDPDYQLGVKTAAEEIAEELVPPSERASFLLAALDEAPLGD